jgi:hypothetical protein
MDEWLDSAHDRIRTALNDLEAALIAAVRKEN